MTQANDCAENADPLKLLHEGTSQEQRLSPALKPAYAPVNERTPANGIVFAQAYAKFLIYYGLANTPQDDWAPFFTLDVSAQLAVAAVEDVEAYRRSIKEYFDVLDNRQNANNPAALRDHLDFLFSACATLATRLNQFAKTLADELAVGNGGAGFTAAGGSIESAASGNRDAVSAFSEALRNLIQSRLAPALSRLIAYHKGGEGIADADKPLNESANEKPAPINVLGGKSLKFSTLSGANLSADWTAGANWSTYYQNVAADASVYGNLSGATLFERVNHIATHNLFTSVLDQFLKTYARLVNDANNALDATLKNWDRHHPHYALFLAFLRLFEYARAEGNTLTGRHLDFYYREILRLKEKPAQPGSVHLLIELAKQVASYELKEGTLFKAGKDDRAIDAFFADDRDFVANQAKVVALKNVYRHDEEKLGITSPPANHEGRIYAAPVANSNDGLGDKLTSVDQSWHPFYNKIYQDGVLAEIKMPQAEIGFAIASHYLLLAEGERKINIDFTVKHTPGGTFDDEDVICFFTGEKGWIEQPASKFSVASGLLHLEVSLSGGDPAVVPYTSKTHGYDFATDLPILLVKLRHRDQARYIYSFLEDLVVENIELKVDVKGLKTLAVANDFGPLDTSKPFQPYGASPLKGSALVIGSREVFQKNLTKASVTVTWLLPPSPFKTSPLVDIEYLRDGKWSASNITAVAVTAESYELLKANNTGSPVVEGPDLAPNEFYGTSSRHGFIRLKLSSDFGQNAYQAQLIRHLRKEIGADNQQIPHPGDPPVGPVMASLSINYTAAQTLSLASTNAGEFERRTTRFFHVAPFGYAEQHPVLNSARTVYLLPQFSFPGATARNKSEAEFYIGVSGLEPPQSLALLFQVVDGTADPLTEKPQPHINWSYLRANEWISFADNEVEDQTDELLNSGTVTFAVPRDASDRNTILPSGLHWIRAAISSASEAVCRLILVAAQAFKATFIDKGNDPAFPAKVLPAGTISKLDQPDAAVKKIIQPFSTFGGRAAERSETFYTRVSERLRHKDRAIAMWDYERLVLEAFPQIYRAKCLNHTHYEPSESGSGIYRELAPGHVTIVTVPNQRFQNLRDPLRPYTSLGLLEEISAFLIKRASCFVKLHVKNPQFEEVRAVFNVRLNEGFDETFYVNKLREEITRFLSPWAFTTGGRPSFGAKIQKAALINFVEEQPYVDYVTDFQLFQDINGVQGTTDKNELEGSKAVSILVSAPAKKHIVLPIKASEKETSGEQCPCEA